MAAEIHRIKSAAAEKMSSGKGGKGGKDSPNAMNAEAVASARKDASGAFTRRKYQKTSTDY